MAVPCVQSRKDDVEHVSDRHLETAGADPGCLRHAGRLIVSDPGLRSGNFAGLNVPDEAAQDHGERGQHE